ncbi:MAG TPA: hypothetical protein VMV56_01315 [Williamwhitmania sp.]|nr:hypothetical protein [Williamwhitmania sp.]
MYNNKKELPVMVAPNIFEQRSANVVHKTINPSSARLEIVAPVV